MTGAVGARYVVRFGTERGSGSYWHSCIGTCRDQWFVRTTASKFTRDEAKCIAEQHGGRVVRLVSRAEAVARARVAAFDEVRGYLAQCDDLKVYVADVVDEIDRLAGGSNCPKGGDTDDHDRCEEGQCYLAKETSR